MQYKRNVILLSIFIITPQATGMEPILKRFKSMLGYPCISIQDLPHDLKGYLLPFIVSKHTQFSDGIFAVKDNFILAPKDLITAATINKSFHKAVNDPGHMLAALQWILQNARYTAHAVDLVEQLQKKKATLPVLHDPKIILWLAQTKSMLQDGPQLFAAINTHNIAPVAECLLNKHMDLNARQGYQRNTPLMICGYGGSKEIIKELLAAKPNLNLQDKTGATALLYAAYGGNIPCVQALIFAGADPDITNARGETPKDIALKYDYKFIAEYLSVASERQKEKKQKKPAPYCEIL